jgi:hypothetical protein
MRVQIQQPLQQLLPKNPSRILRQLRILLNQLKQIPTRTVLKDDPQMVPGLVPIGEFQNVDMVQVVENTYFVENFLAAAFFDGFDSDVLNALLFATFVDDGVLSAPNFLVYVVVVHMPA